MDCIICRYGELALKGKNRNLFEDRLVSNIRVCLNRNGIDAKIKKVHGRIFVFTEDQSALTHLRHIFGLVSISPAVAAEADIDKISAAVLEYAKSAITKDTKTFRMSSHRVNKKFPKSSNELDVLLGSLVNEKFGLKVSLKEHDLDIGVEIHDTAFIYHEKMDCPGGLPLGISGNVACLIEDEKGIAAAWLVMRRGCAVFPVLLKDVDISRLVSYSYGTDIISSRIGTIEEANDILQKRKCMALVVGDLFEDFDPERYLGIKKAVLTPLIGHDKEQLSTLLARIR